MAFRQQEYRELCTLCDVPGTDRCARCSRPLCAEHAVPEGVRCDPCEADFQHRERQLASDPPPDRDVLSAEVLGIIGGAMAACALIGGGLLALIGSLPVLLLIAGAAAVNYWPQHLPTRKLAEKRRRHHLRADFLAERGCSAIAPEPLRVGEDPEA